MKTIYLYICLILFASIPLMGQIDISTSYSSSCDEGTIQVSIGNSTSDFYNIEFYQDGDLVEDRTFDGTSTNFNYFEEGWHDIYIYNDCGCVFESEIYVEVEGCSNHCDNDVRDGDELGIDCGGSCPTCPFTPHTPTCTSRVSAHPNAFNNYLVVEFAIPFPTEVSMRLVGVHGKANRDLTKGTQLRTLAYGEIEACLPNLGVVPWDGDIINLPPLPNLPTGPIKNLWHAGDPWTNTTTLPVGVYQFRVSNLQRLQGGNYILQMRTRHDVQRLNLMKIGR